MRILLPVFLIALALSATAATKYVPANDSQPLIRRDLLPLDVDAIRELAQNLATLADGPLPKSASQIRHRAQALTLSQRLSPAQPRTRAIQSAFLSGEDRPQPGGAEVKSAQRNLFAVAGWLAKLPTDSEGYRLGQLLLDILNQTDGSDPALKLHESAGTSKRWQGVVAKVTDFEVINLPVVPGKPDKPGPANGNNAKYAVTALLTEIPMFAVGLEEGDKPSSGLITTSLVITTTEATTRTDPKTGKEVTSKTDALRFQPEPGFDLSSLHGTLETFFAANLNPLPEGYNLNINTNKRRYLAKNRENIATPIAMMLDSAVTNRPLRRNTILFARLRADGRLEKPVAAWELLLRLEALKLAPGTRLIVGSGMMEEMTALLVMEKASFFTKYEVIEAPTFKAARELYFADGKPDARLVSAMAGYEEVRQKALQTKNLATFLGLSSVEGRLVKARDFWPGHLSATLLAEQAIRRPAYFTRFMFAQELDRRLEELSRFRYTIDKTLARAMKDAYKKTKETLDPMKRRLQRAEETVFDDAINLIKELNSVGRGASAFLDNQEELRKKDLETFQAKLAIFRSKLRKIYLPAENK